MILSKTIYDKGIKTY